MLGDIFRQLATLVDKYSNGSGLHSTAIPSLKCIKAFESTPSVPVIYQPSLCLMVQGRKKVMLADEIYEYQPAEYLVASVGLPLVGQVIDATPDKPFLCLQLEMDPIRIAELVNQMDMVLEAKSSEQHNTRRGLFVGKTTETIADAALRLLRLLDTPGDIPFMAPLIIDEIFYRLLKTDYGVTIANLSVKGNKTYGVAAVIQLLKTNFSQTIRIEEMADLAGMSPSSLHQNFKAVTAMSPLQYQKRLRLVEARRILMEGEESAARTAILVGYESPSQFSRDYARYFGTPPKRDLNAIQGDVRFLQGV